MNRDHRIIYSSTTMETTTATTAETVDTAQQAATATVEIADDSNDNGGGFDQEHINNLNRTIRLERDQQVVKYLQGAGVPIVKDESGRVSIKRTIAQLSSLATATGNDEQGGGIATEVQSAAIKATQQENERLRQLVQDAESKALAAAQEKEQFILRGTLATSFGSDVVDGGMELAVNEFLRQHEIIDAEGETIIKRNGNIVLGAKSKPATLKEAATQFLDSTPFLRRATGNVGGQVHGTVVGGVRAITQQEFAEGKYDPNDLLTGKLKVIG